MLTAELQSDRTQWIAGNRVPSRGEAVIPLQDPASGGRFAEVAGVPELAAAGEATATVGSGVDH